MNIENTYFHTMSVARYSTYTNPKGREVSQWTDIPSLQFIPCGYSQSNRNSMNTTQTETTNVIKNNPKVFCNPNLDIQAGDRLSIRYGTRLLGKFQASEACIYDSHQEIALLKDSEAPTNYMQELS